MKPTNDLLVDLPDEELDDLRRFAAKAGVTLERYAREAIRMHLGLPVAQHTNAPGGVSDVDLPS